MKHLSVDNLISLLISLKADMAAWDDLWRNSRRVGTVDADILLDERKALWAKRDQIIEEIRRKAGPAKAKYALDVIWR